MGVAGGLPACHFEKAPATSNSVLYRFPFVRHISFCFRHNISPLSLFNFRIIINHGCQSFKGVG